MFFFQTPYIIFYKSSCRFQSRGSRAVFQFYPENPSQIELITSQAMKSGFSGGLVVDYPNSTKAKKFFLVLMTGGAQALPKALGTETAAGSHVQYENSRDRFKQSRGQKKSVKKSRDWILEKKERRRKQGKDVRPDSKFTGRKRSGKLYWIHRW